MPHAGELPESPRTTAVPASASQIGLGLMSNGKRSTSALLSLHGTLLDSRSAPLMNTARALAFVDSSFVVQ